MEEDEPEAGESETAREARLQKQARAQLLAIVRFARDHNEEEDLPTVVPLLVDALWEEAGAY